jgi:hypothetical protein
MKNELLKLAAEWEYIANSDQSILDEWPNKTYFYLDRGGITVQVSREKLIGEISANKQCAKDLRENIKF